MRFLKPLEQRTISSFVMFLFFACVLWLGGLAFSLFLAFIFVLMVAEWLRMLVAKEEWPHSFLFYISLILSIISFLLAAFLTTSASLNEDGLVSATGTLISPGFLEFENRVLWGWGLGLMGTSLIVVLNRGSITRKSIAIWPPYLLAASLAILGIYQTCGEIVLLWLLVLVWATDTGAYFIGRAVGGPKLMSRISPNKTISGAVGGLASAVLFSWLFVLFFDEPRMFGQGLMLAVITACLSVLSQIGDLFESFSKRYQGIKDSSNLIPGHGGVLDRFDGLLLTAPVAYFFFLAWG